MAQTRAQTRTTTDGSTQIGRRELAKQIATRMTGISESHAYELLGEFTTVVTENLAAGRSVALTGFGTWSPVRRAERAGMNIRTKQPITIPARNSANFSLGAHLKGALEGVGGAPSGAGGQRTRAAGPRGGRGKG